ncbi:MAG TPA: kelch repeat-containing protein [Candidatus Binataceae bacterium]|nr:kelch repeat-containing protein [Candidatus Binataceae bacterium]
MALRLGWFGVVFGMILMLAGCGGDSSSSPLATPTPTPTPAPGDSFAPAASTPTMNQARASASAALLNNGKVLIAGGLAASGPTNSVELYDPASNSFASAASLPTMNTARFDATATLLGNGKVLIAGGVGISGTLDTVELYDSTNNTFASASSLPSMNMARFGATATLLNNGRVLMAGGFVDLYTALGTIEMYDPAASTFAPAASLPTMGLNLRGAPTATLLSNGNLLIAGGFEGLFGFGIPEVNSSTDLYQPATNSFAASSPLMLEDRYMAAATLLPTGNVLIAGGLTACTHFTESTQSVDLYDATNSTFLPASSLPTMNTSRSSATATLLPNGKVLIAGGSSSSCGPANASPTILASVELYYPTTNSFSPAALTPTMNNARSEATATLLPNGKTLIAGGLGVSGPLDSVELYSP